MTRTGMNDKEVAEQLIIDIERYQAVPECQILVCFVYDPEGFIENPLALKRYCWRIQEVGKDTPKRVFFLLSVGNMNHLSCLRKIERPFKSRIRQQYP